MRTAPFGRRRVRGEHDDPIANDVGAAVALVLGLSLAAAGCGKYSWSTLKAQKAYKDGNDLYQAQDWKGAAAKYEAGAGDRPQTSAEIYFYLGNSYDNLYKPATRARPRTTPTSRRRSTNYQKAADKDPKPEMKKLALEYLVAAYGPDKLNDPAKAEPIVQKMIQIEPNEPTNYFALAKIYEDAGRYDEAEAGADEGQRGQAERPARSTRPSPASTTARATSRRRSRRSNKAAELEPEQPAGLPARRHLLLGQGLQGPPPAPTPQKKDYIEKGLAMRGQGARRSTRTTSRR